MANNFASTTQARTLALLKNWYQGPIVSQFNDELPLYREIEKGSEKWNGLQVVRPIKVRRNQGIGATSDGGNLPAIGFQTTQQAIIAAKFNYLRFGVTGPMIKASQGDKGSFASAQAFEMEQGLIDLKNDVNRQLFWNGNSTIATVAANVVSSNVITVSGRSTGEIGAKYIDVDTVIDIYTAAGALVASSLFVTSVANATSAVATLTVNATVSTNATDVIVRAGTFGNEIQGLLYTLDGGTSVTYGIDRSVYPQFQGNALDCLGGQLTLDLLQQGYNLGKSRGGAKFDAMYVDYTTERYYNKLLVADRRYAVKMTGDGTFSNKDSSYLEFAGRPLVSDKDCPNNFFMLDSSQWKKYVLAELEWSDEAGTYYIAQTGTDAFEARLRLFANIFCEKPAAQVVIKNYISP